MILKICGITRQCDADTAVLAGANTIGFILAPESARYVAPRDVRSIIRDLPMNVRKCGVFVNPSRDEVRATIEETGIDMVQFHGEEEPEDTEGFEVTVWKAFRIGRGFDCRMLGRYSCEAFLLDTLVEGKRGGTGRTFNWDIALKAKRYGAVILSGGITPENVASAIRRVKPDGVDCNSGVEHSPGIKDGERIKRLSEAIREVSCSL